MDNFELPEFIVPEQLNTGEWDTGFEGDRRVVVAKLGPYSKVFARPAKYSKRFYHKIFALTIEDWTLSWDIKILSGYCVINSTLNVRFQPTIQYAEQHLEALADLNARIKQNYESLLKDAIEKEIRQAEDSDSILQGLEEVETRIETMVNETLMEQGIQCRAHSALEPTFKDLPADDSAVSPTGHFKHERMVLQIMRRTHDLQMQRKRERFQFERDEETSKFEHKKKQLELNERETDLVRAKQSQVTEKLKAEIEAEEKRQNEQQKSEERRLTEQIKHQERIRQIELDAEIEEKRRRLEASTDAEGQVQREIELLVLERQRMILKEEIKGIAAKGLRALTGRKPNRDKVDKDDAAKSDKP